ncbi:MAG TPA: SufD family Fe-S cluster assembly protein [Acidimicrobiales bacterium]|nr:SufD family Fe-S cluster assembly protein [Acidimicrobiales bacterium]
MTLTAFTADVSSALVGPRWLAGRRSAAWERFAGGSLPHEAEEVWRYSGIDRFDLESFAPVPPTPRPEGLDLEVGRALAEPFGSRAALVVTYNGAVVGVERSVTLHEDQLTVSSVLSDAEAPAGLGELAPAHDAFGELHDAFLTDVVHIVVAKKAVLRHPVVVVHLVDRVASSGSASAFPRSLVHVGPSAEAGVIELVASVGGVETTGAAGAERVAAPVLVIPVTELEVEDDAHLGYANLQVLDQSCTELAVQASRVGRNATLRSFTVSLGGGYARVRTDSDLIGQGGHTSLLAAYLGTDKQVHDFRTLQDHHAPRTESELLFKGAVADEARSVYSGLIHIRNGAHGARAFQTNHNLVLSEGAHADSVPNLDIEENDVRCSHASTVGPIDEDQRYYLESRGISPAVAERLIVLGFFSDLANRAPFPGVGPWVDNAVSHRLAGRLPSDRAGSATGAVDG